LRKGTVRKEKGCPASWLEAAGFTVGQEYEVAVDDGKLVIVAV